MPPTLHALYGEECVKFVIREGAVNLKAIRDRFQLSYADLDGVCYPEDPDGWSVGSDFKEGDTVTVTGATTVAAAAAQPPATQPAPAGMQLFWHALQSTTCLSADGLLELQDGAFFMGDELYGSRMVLRDSYQTLYTRIKDLLRAGLNRRFVVTGTPGIGKSFFKFPLMHWLVEEGMAKHIVLEMQGRRYLFSKGVDVLVGGMQAFEDKLDHQSTWWIVDMSVAYERTATTVVLSSPNKKHYNEFLKLLGATKLYMNLWTDEEIHKCRATCFPGLSEETVDELQAKWGNIPRYVLEKAHDRAAQASLDEALAKCKLSAIEDCIGEPDSGDEASHKLVHLHVLDGPPKHCDKVMVMASAYVSRKLAERAATLHVDWLQRLVNLSISEPAYRAAAGSLFEAYAHRRLQAGGSFKVRKLGSAEAVEPLVLPAAPSIMVFHKVEEVAIAADDVYCLPKVHNFLAVDALSQPRNLYQMTITQKRSIHAQGLDKARSQLRLAPRRLYFCVPGALYPEFGAVGGIAAGIEQWALEVPGFD